MVITKVEALYCDAGWRPWTFVKISTDEGLVGWSECSDSHGSPRGLEGVIKDLSSLLVGQDPRLVEKLYWLMYSRTRQSPGSIIQKAIGGIENALLDIKAKALSVPVYELFGGPVRETIPLYWSHFATSRVRDAAAIGKPQMQSLSELKELIKEVKSSGFKVIKPKVAFFGEKPEIYMAGFAKSDGWPELNVDNYKLKAIDKWASALRDAAGDDIDIILDLNFNFKTEGFIKIGRMLEKYNLMWLELDSYDPGALRLIRDSVKIPIASGEDLYGARQYRPYLERHAMDIVISNPTWNGFIRAKEIAALAELQEMNFAPHNHNGHLATFISAQLSAVIPNLRIMELDVEDVPWRDEVVTNVPKIINGQMELPKGPGWGTEINEKALKQHPWPK
ncbi:MAG: mandelate racemase/muconate lactonizing enzyme family protein [Candidatus Harrisonbacteria bacterium]|nr:mandelate racemase/muconate lactonizing enzyme family protein [Candidatus Harrisonbacteria bacterium]